jgi:microcystin-dependent protein
LDPFVGLIALFPYPFTPNGWFTCDGQVLSVNEYQPLFALIGNRFGGDGEQTFLLPKLEGPAPGLRYFIAFEGLYPSAA